MSHFSARVRKPLEAPNFTVRTRTKHVICVPSHVGVVLCMWFVAECRVALLLVYFSQGVRIDRSHTNTIAYVGIQHAQHTHFLTEKDQKRIVFFPKLMSTQFSLHASTEPTKEACRGFFGFRSGKCCRNPRRNLVVEKQHVPGMDVQCTDWTIDRKR